MKRSDIQAFLTLSLPTYMIPSNFFVINEIPVKFNGKIDKVRLPLLARKLSGDKSLVPPQNKEEKAIADIWIKVLGIKELGIDDNFFELGGDSISILKVYSELNKAFEMQINVVDLFIYTTIRGLADHYRSAIVMDDEEDIEESYNMLLNSSQNFEIND